jgi:hypothetical protein
MTDPAERDELAARADRLARSVRLTQAELKTFARALRLAVPAPALREEYLRRAEAELAREAELRKDLARRMEDELKRLEANP